MDTLACARMFARALSCLSRCVVPVEEPLARLRSFALSVVAIAALAPLSGDAAVGRTPGAANVSGSGEASYSVPIFAPPGTHGMTPQMALVYGHRFGGTLVGTGWSIAGLSSISRCQRTWASDGEARDVRNDALDRFCLDGNKLRLTGGTYSLAGSTYQTEIETFSRATAYGSAGNGPASFLVETKDGLIYEYGNTTDSRIESLGQSTVRAWAVNKIRDRSGNAILFTYSEDATNGAYRIESVQYTQNTGEGLAPAYEIDFVWQTKPSNEIDSGYIAGSLVKQVTRLDRIDVKYNSSIVRSYELTYEPALSSTSKSRLASIEECAGSPLECLTPSAFVYQNGAAGMTVEADTGQSVAAKPLPMDVNGDGRTDLVYSSSTTSGSGSWMVMLANASGGYGAPSPTGVTNTNYSDAIVIDYNADGFDDLLVPYSGSTWWVMLGSSSGLSSPADTSAPVTATGRGNNASAFDVNGDGLDDLVWADLVGYAGGDAIRYRLREWGGAFSSTIYTLVGSLPADQMITSGVFSQGTQPALRRVPDINVDGRGDVLVRRNVRVWIDEGSGGHYNFVRFIDVYTGGGAVYSSVPNPNASSVPYFGDFNGDGKTDIVYMSGAGGIVARLSTGTGLTGEVAVTSLSVTDWSVLDWDGDGYDDLLLASGGVWQLLRSTGESFIPAQSTGIAAGSQTTVADINGDGLADFASTVGGTWRYRLHQGNYPDLLQTASDGFGNAVTFSYAPLTSASYTKYADASFPEQDYLGSMHVVSNYVASNGIGGNYTTYLWYYGARIHLQGRGFEGFALRITQDSRNNLYTYDRFSRSFPTTGRLNQRDVYQSNNSTLISRTQNTWSVYPYPSTEARWLPYVSQTIASRYEVEGTYNGSLVSTSTTNFSVDTTSGLAYDTTTTVVEASTANGAQPGASYVQRTYLPTAYLVNNTTTWCLGRPGRVEVTNSHNQWGGGSITRTSTTTWNETLCRPDQVVEEPGNGQLQVALALHYDDFGNVDSTTVTGTGMTARTTSAYWGTTGQFPRSVTNALSQATQFDWNYALGLPAKETDANGIEVSSQEQDPFGRMTRENRPDHTATTWAYSSCTTAGCVNSNNKMLVIETQLDSSGATITDRKFYTDGLDRLLVASSRMLSGQYNRVEREYDALGRLSRESAPCWWSGCAPFWTVPSYDLLDRPKSVSRPVSDSDPSLATSYSYYEGLTIRTVDALGKQSIKVANVAGAVARSTDHDNYSQNFDYDAFGNVVRVMDSIGNPLLSNTFNIRGMRTGQSDMDVGSWSYVHNALGEVSSQTDANGATTTFEYDLLGRPTYRYEPDAAGPTTTEWHWGTSAQDHNIGQLQRTYIHGSTVIDNRQEYRRDSTGRISQVEYAGGGNNYFVDYNYNATTGQLETLTYPESTPGYRLQLLYEYQGGRLARVRDGNAYSTVFWEANTVDAWGHVLDEALGNGIRNVHGYDQVTGSLDYALSGPNANGTLKNVSYTWDRVGNLVERRDERQGLTEHFYYDNLHRLDHSTLNGSINLGLGYDVLGNITSKSDVGSYTYHPTKKHAVVSTTAPGALSFSYDNNGNQITRNGQSVSWYVSNMPRLINGGSSASSEFHYTAARARWLQIANYGGTLETTTSIGGLLDKVVVGSTTLWRHYIAGASGTVAVYTRKSTGTDEIRYVTHDHLGSIDSITNAAGTPQASLSYSAFGLRREEATWSGDPTSGVWTQIASTARAGFTEHEMLDNLKLIHMNGRVYDPVIGRFLSADPFVDGVGSTQGWNRYAYVGNNPLSFVDPSGFEKERGLLSWIDGPQHSGFSGADAQMPNPGTVASMMADLLPFYTWSYGGPAPRPDLWSLRRDVVPPGALPWPDWNTPPSDTPRPIPVPRGLGNGGESTVGGLGQGFLNAVPGAYYAGQSQLAWDEGRYLLGAGLYAAALGDAALGVVTLGESTALIGSIRAAGTNLTRALRLPNYSTSLGRRVLGSTDPAGNVTIAAGLTRAEQALTLRHESVHAFFSARGTGLVARLRQQLGMWGYNNSQLLRFTEEALAEGYATRSLRQGLAHPLNNGYGITPFGLFLEGSIFGGAFYAGYELVDRD